MFAIVGSQRFTCQVSKIKYPFFRVRSILKVRELSSKPKVTFEGLTRTNVTVKRTPISACCRLTTSTQQRCLFTHRPSHLLITRLPDAVLRCQFHTTGRRSALIPPLLALIATLSKVAAALTGRSIRKWLHDQPPQYRRYVLIFFIAALLSLGLFALCYYKSHIQEAPVTGRKRFITLDKEQSCKIANFELKSLLEQFKDSSLPATHPYYQMVVNTGMRLVTSNKDVPGMADQNWVVHVVKCPDKNAFVLPNGHIFVYTGMLEFCQNQDQLAVILGHEMAHAVLLHSAEQLSHTQFSDKIIIGLMTALWTLMPNDGIALVYQWFCNKVKQLHIDMPYSRELEREADQVGLQMAAKACFDVREGSVLWARMSINDDLNGTEKQPQYLSTHPTHEKRVKNINELIPKNLALMERCDCAKLPEPDPRLKIQELRAFTDNVMIARAAKVNLQRAEKIETKAS